MRRPILRSTLLALAGSLLVASSVAASAPTRELIPQGDFLIPGGTGSCTFDVSLHVTANRYYERS